jgi:hypothetical protein
MAASSVEQRKKAYKPDMATELAEVNNLQLQQFLRSGKTPEDLKAEFGINYKRHSEHPELITFKYDQVKSKPHLKVVRVARGIILNSKDNWNVVAFPFVRFFNEGESQADEIDWSTSRVYDKLDGSIIIMYWYGDKWNFATSGTPDARTLLPLIRKIWAEKGYSYPSEEYRSKTFMFEMLSPENQIVVPQFTNQLVLIGVRDISTFKEEDPELIAYCLGYSVVQTHTYSSLRVLIVFAKGMSKQFGEGFVVCDQNFRRLKIKSEDYVQATHGTKSGDQRITILNVVMRDETSEYIATFGSHEDVLTMVSRIQQAYFYVVNIMDSYYDRYSADTADKATFCKNLTLHLPKEHSWMKPGLIQMFISRQNNKPLAQVQTQIQAQDWISKTEPTKLINYLNL